MSTPLCTIGAATLQVIGLGPTAFDYKSRAHWPHQAVFGSGPFYQPTGMDERVLTLRLAARPHVSGGLDQYAIIKQHHERQDVVTFMRLIEDAGGLYGEVVGQMAIVELGHQEQKIAPGGLGWHHEFEASLHMVGSSAAGGF